jgi:hypothetical protein
MDGGDSNVRRMPEGTINIMIFLVAQTRNLNQIPTNQLSFVLLPLIANIVLELSPTYLCPAAAAAPSSTTTIAAVGYERTPICQSRTESVRTISVSCMTLALTLT